MHGGLALGSALVLVALALWAVTPVAWPFGYCAFGLGFLLVVLGATTKQRWEAVYKGHTVRFANGGAPRRREGSSTGLDPERHAA